MSKLFTCPAPMLTILSCAQTFCYILGPAGHGCWTLWLCSSWAPIHSSSYLLHGVLQMKWNLLLPLTQPEIKSTREENSSPSLVAKWKKIINDFLLLNLMGPLGGVVQNIPFLRWMRVTHWSKHSFFVRKFNFRKNFFEPSLTEDFEFQYVPEKNFGHKKSIIW